MTYAITLDASQDAALAALVTDSGYLAVDLLHSFVSGGLQGRVAAQQQLEKDTWYDTFLKADDTATKAEILAVKDVIIALPIT